MKKLTVSEAAARLGVTTRRVIALINAESKQKRLPATRFGRRAWVINEADLKKVEERKPGRPPKASVKKEAKGDRA